MGRDEDYGAYVGARWNTLVRTAVMLGCPLEEAEDVTQEALLRAYVAWDKVIRADNRDAYVYRILLNTVISGRRRKWRSERPKADVQQLSERGDDEAGIELADAVLRALDRLPVKHRAVILLRYYASLSEKEIAEAMKIPVGTVKSRLSRAHARLSQDSPLADTLNGGTP
jgi:RNA polymerase sigma-70 factor (sigma-E family)